MGQSKEIFRGGKGNLIPFLAKEVVIETLRIKDVSFNMCFGEADKVMASAAKSMRCPLLSQDSDFVIFDLEEGYIPLQYFDWRNGNSENGIPCLVYKTEYLLKQFGAKSKDWILPLFAIVAGNDFVSVDTFANFYKHLPRNNKKNFGFNKKHLRMIQTLEWLSQRETQERAIELLLQYVGKEPREKLKDKLHGLLEQYSLDYQEPIPSCLRGLPDYFLELRQSGKMPSFSVVVIHGGPLFLSTLIEDCRMESVYNCCAELRREIYGILRNKEGDLEGETVVEYSRKDSNISKGTVKLELYQNGISLSSIAEMSVDERLQIFCNLMGMDLKILNKVLNSEVPTMFCLSILFWIRKSTLPTQSRVYALLLSRWLLAYQDTEFQNRNLFAEFFENVRKTCEGNDPECWKNVHCFNQWQVVLLTAHWLNSVLNNPIESEKFSLCYSGTFVVKLATFCQKLVAISLKNA